VLVGAPSNSSADASFSRGTLALLHSYPRAALTVCVRACASPAGRAYAYNVARHLDIAKAGE